MQDERLHNKWVEGEGAKLRQDKVAIFEMRLYTEHADEMKRVELLRSSLGLVGYKMYFGFAGAGEN